MQDRLDAPETGRTETAASRKKGKSGRGLKKALLIVCALLLLSGAAGFFFLRHFVKKINKVDESTQSVLSRDEYIRLMRELYGSDWMPDTVVPAENSTAAASGSPTASAKSSEAAGTAVPAASASAGTELPALPSKNRPTGKSRETEHEDDGPEETEADSGGADNGDADDDTPGHYRSDSVWVQAEPMDDEDLINVMLLGNDYLSSGIGFSDTMILCSINPDSHQVSLISFMRDMNVPIGEFGHNNINHAYAIGGFSMVDRVMYEDFGLHIDGFVSVGIKDMAQIIENMGGADIFLTQEEADVLNEIFKAYPGMRDPALPDDPETLPETQPESSTAAEPESSTAAEPESSTAAEPESSTAAEPESSTAAEPENSTAAEPESSTAAEPENSTASSAEAETGEAGSTENAAEPSSAEGSGTEAPTAGENPESTSAEAAEGTTAEETAADRPADETAGQPDEAGQNETQQPESSESNAPFNGYVTAGWNHLTGEQAVEYARIRKIDSDYARVERQRILLNTLFEKVRNASLGSLMSMLDDILPLITTDMTDGEIMSCAGKTLPYFSSTVISSYRLPAEGSYYGDFSQGQYVLRSNQYKNITYLKSILPY